MYQTLRDVLHVDCCPETDTGPPWSLREGCWVGSPESTGSPLLSTACISFTSQLLFTSTSSHAPWKAAEDQQPPHFTRTRRLHNTTPGRAGSRTQLTNTADLSFPLPFRRSMPETGAVIRPYLTTTPHATLRPCSRTQDFQAPVF